MAPKWIRSIVSSLDKWSQMSREFSDLLAGNIHHWDGGDALAARAASTPLRGSRRRHTKVLRPHAFAITALSPVIILNNMPNLRQRINPIKICDFFNYPAIIRNSNTR